MTQKVRLICPSRQAGLTDRKKNAVLLRGGVFFFLQLYNTFSIGDIFQIFFTHGTYLKYFHNQ